MPALTTAGETAAIRASLERTITPPASAPNVQVYRVNTLTNAPPARPSFTPQPTNLPAHIPGLDNPVTLSNKLAGQSPVSTAPSSPSATVNYGGAPSTRGMSLSNRLSGRTGSNVSANPNSLSSRLSGRAPASTAPTAPTLSYGAPGQPSMSATSLSNRLAGRSPISNPPTLRTSPLVPSGPSTPSPPSVIPTGGPSSSALNGLRPPAGMAAAVPAALSRLAGAVGVGLLLSDAWNRQQQLNQLWSELLFPTPSPPPSGGPSFSGPVLPSFPLPPFKGGQGVGVPYIVRVRRITTRKDGQPDGPVGTFITEHTVTGPVGGIYKDSSDPERDHYYLQAGGQGISLSVTPREIYDQTMSIVDVRRADGGVDTDGDPPSEGRTGTGPGVQPVTAPSPSASSLSPPGAAPALVPGGAPSGGSSPSGGTTPGNQGQPGEKGITPFNLPGGMPLPIPLGMPAGIAPGSGSSSPGTAPYPPDSPNPTPKPSPSPSPSTNPPGPAPEPPTPFCRYQSFLDQQILANTNSANVVLGVITNTQLANIDNKLGPQIPNGGLSGIAQKTSKLLGKTWDFLQVDRVLNVLTWIAVLHNAYMLSNALAQTLFSAIANVLDVFGIEDSEGEALDVGKIVGKWTDGFFKTVFGVETVNGIKDTWKKWNRIYQAAANIVNSIQSMMYSMANALELIGNYVALIGNAAKKFGVFAESCYRWMNPNFNFTQNRFFNALNNAQEAVETIDEVASEVKSIQDTGAELFKQKEELTKSVEAAVKTETDKETAEKQKGLGPTVKPEDERKPES